MCCSAALGCFSGVSVFGERAYVCACVCERSSVCGRKRKLGKFKRMRARVCVQGCVRAWMELIEESLCSSSSTSFVRVERAGGKSLCLRCLLQPRGVCFYEAAY